MRTETVKYCVVRDISTKKRLFAIESWRYWKIIEELRWHGIDQQEAYDASTWATRSKIGESYQSESGLIFEICEGRKAHR